MLEIVEPAIGSMVEIGGDGGLQALGVAAAVSEVARRFGQNQRRAIGGTEDDAAMTPPAVGDRDGERVRRTTPMDGTAW